MKIFICIAMLFSSSYLYAFVPDTVVNNLCLMNASCVIDSSLNIVLDDLFNDVASCAIASSDESELLEVVVHPGLSYGQVAIYEITSIIDDDLCFVKSGHERFKTESGISLGVDEDYVAEVKGKPHKVEVKDGFNIYRYKLSDFKTSAFLKRYNMPEYQANYYFKQGKLIRFNFGFIYP